jgi:HEAT repeat protein
VDFAVRQSCLHSLADMGGTGAEQMLVDALAHWDPETRRVAAREIGRAGADSAVPAMLRILQGYYFFEQNYSLKKDVIGSLEALGSPAAVPALRRMAGRKFVFGRKNRELRFLARGALAGIEATGTTEGRATRERPARAT